MRETNEEKLQAGDRANDDADSTSYNEELEIRDSDYWIDYGGEG